MTAAMARDADFERTPPNDEAAEQCVLGAMMLSAEAIADVTPIIRPGDHYRPAHQIIHEAILALYENGQPADYVAVHDLLAKRGELLKVGAGAYLHTLTASVPTWANAGYHAGIVRRCAVRRHAIEVGTRIVQLGYESSDEPEGIATAARTMADGILPADDSGGPQDIGDLFYEVLGSLENSAPRGLPVPWKDLNELTNGLGDGEMIVLAARPGTGKSIAGLQMAAHLALHCGEPAVIFSMEMRRQEILLRLISAEARIPFHALMSRQLTDEHWQRISAVQDKITSAPLVIDDTPGCSLPYARGRLRAMKRTTPARLAVFDYMQLLTGGSRTENRQVEVSGYARGIKLLADEMGIPIVAIAQLNRGPAHRSDRRPELSDLRESGEIENAANVVMLLHREDTNGQETPRTGEIDITVAKNRNGPPGVVRAAFQGHYMRIVDMAPEWSPTSSVSEAS